jgi:hypothetical protein
LKTATAIVYTPIAISTAKANTDTAIVNTAIAIATVATAHSSYIWDTSEVTLLIL